MRKWIDQGQAEKFVGMSRVTLWAWRKAGKLPYRKVGREIFYEAVALRKLVRGGDEDAK